MVLLISFSGSAWERTAARLCFASCPVGRWPTLGARLRGRASRKCPPRQSLGSRVPGCLRLPHVWPRALWQFHQLLIGSWLFFRPWV